ncbi:MAG: tRNA pseudouridine(55) synthase TruB [Gallionellales bacterium 35-53-114]|jgi:tRNA pseudouridine55 synthase|nr:MAG: tRNA pseudouridine(55) synthase TruB [Gallionellales bacterium 35-53-114]OYZ62447.1 MAG: tRNA pseudouridine(55) synthase TruB [Gallionellales bacterium 24-53-125]OZB08507.1 MAG: tRNA pseudouridine(55) synthase TruB [Gallionellales bacterium 39-52-133]HQS59476.1 tRNA pseudouridine(55) synthase TruB [Gallionellaceae bacterium]HQS76389.1 tRNA pseudouridine(55) synthase TruB [Gallionellaceae bacterium]
MAGKWRSLDGVLLFDKPLELSSNIALQKVRRLFQAEKAGHTGTLDPLATGLLPVCFGEATKFSVGLLESDKTYRARIKLGQTTTTGDAEGEITASHEVNVSEGQVQEALQTLRGEIQQLPPMHSALKHQGKPLYEYIRKGETIERELRNVVIHELVLEHFAADEMDISVRCSKGTYVRTLAEDIGRALGCGAHLTGLRRTRISEFSLDNAYTLSQLESMTSEERDACLLPLDCMLLNLPKLDLDEVQVSRLAQGQRLGLDLALPDGKLRLYAAGEFVGLGELSGRRLAPSRLVSSVARRAAQRGGTVKTAETCVSDLPA